MSGLALLTAASGASGSLPPITGGHAGPSSAEGSTVAFGSPFAVGTGASASGGTSAGTPAPAGGLSLPLVALVVAGLALVAWLARR